MKILVLGRKGQISFELIEALKDRHHAVSVLGSNEIDFTQPNQVHSVLSQFSEIDVVINAAAYTAVDRAEDEPAVADAVNHLSVARIAQWCAQNDVWLVHYSTDYVFDGNKREEPFIESDVVAPINVYGKTKLDGERAIIASACRHLILRTSWVYANRGHNFFLTMIKLAEGRDELEVVDDQFGVPNSAYDLAIATIYAMEKLPELGAKVSGIYHLTAQPETTWYHFARAIFAGLDLNINVKTTTSSAFPTKAKRPRYSVMNNDKFCTTFDYRFPDWQDALQRVIKIYNTEKGI